MACLFQLLVYIRLACVSPGYLRKCAREESAIRTSPDCMFMFSEALAYKLDPICFKETPSFVTPRKTTSSDNEVDTKVHEDRIAPMKGLRLFLRNFIDSPRCLFTWRPPVSISGAFFFFCDLNLTFGCYNHSQAFLRDASSEAGIGT